MGYRYAFVRNGTVVEIEKRTENDTEPSPISKYYHPTLWPWFIEIRPGDNAPVDREVAKGWLYLDGQFSEPEPFTINPETGEMYLPTSISAEQFWQVFQDNVQLRNENAQLAEQVTNLQLALVEIYEGVITNG